jgi:hypothetical protein
MNARIKTNLDDFHTGLLLKQIIGRIELARSLTWEGPFRFQLQTSIQMVGTRT